MLRPAKTKVEFIIVIAIILIIVSILGGYMRRDRESSNRIQCADHLRQIGQAILLCSNDQRGGAFPRTRESHGPIRIPTWGTNPAATDPFGPDGPAENDVTGGLFLMLRIKNITPTAFVCPSTSGRPHDSAGASAKQRSNFTNLRRNLSYSYNNPHLDDDAMQRFEPAADGHLRRICLRGRHEPGHRRWR